MILLSGCGTKGKATGFLLVQWTETLQPQAELMNNSDMTSWRLYILRTASGILYTGITVDVTRRFSQHQSGKGARALRGKGPLELLFHCEAGNRSTASKLEYQVKQLKRKDKLRLVAHQPDSIDQWLDELKNG